MLLRDGFLSLIWSDSRILRSNGLFAFSRIEKLSNETNVSQAREWSRIGDGSGLTRNMPVRTDLPKWCIRLWRLRSVEPTYDAPHEAQQNWYTTADWQLLGNLSLYLSKDPIEKVLRGWPLGWGTDKTLWGDRSVLAWAYRIKCLKIDCLRVVSLL